MPRYYCDYCDTYLTHDSPSVRKQHNAGYKHKANVRAYYQQFEEQQTQSLIDQKVKEHLGHTAAVYQQAQMGGAFHQHLNALGQFKPPITLPVLPIPGSTTAVAGSASLPSIRPPVLPVPSIPTAGSSVGYGSTAAATQFRVPPPPPRPPGITAPPGQSGGSTVMQQNGLPRPPVLPPPPGASSAATMPPGVTGTTVPKSTSAIGANGPTPPYTSLYQNSVYRNQSYNPPPGTTPSYPQQQVATPPVANSQHNQQRGLSQTPGSQSSYGYGPPSQTPYAGPTSGSSVQYRN